MFHSPCIQIFCGDLGLIHVCGPMFWEQIFQKINSNSYVVRELFSGMETPVDNMLRASTIIFALPGW